MTSNLASAVTWTALACGAAAAAPAASNSTRPSVSAAADSLPAWMTVDSAARTVHLELETAPAAGGHAVINGRRDGGVQIVVPVNWTVRWRWHSTDSTATHSLVVMAEREKLPERGGRPALSNAMTRMVTAGLRAGQTDETTFLADQPGWYWLLCGVPAHALGGEWIGLRVDPDAHTAGVRQKP